MAFKAIIAADYLSDAIDAVSALVDECRLNLTEDGIDVCAVDAANVASVSLELKAGAFESYEADGGTIGIALEPLEEVLKLADSGELLYFELDEETRKLHIQVDTVEYTAALIDPDSMRNEPDIPDLDLPGRFVLEGKEFDRAVRAADLCADHISIEATVDDEQLVFEGQGDKDDATLTLENEDLLDAGVSEDCHSLFSLDYLKDMRKPIPGAAETSLLLGNGMPTKIRYSVAEGDAKVEYMLAPRVEA